MILGVDQILGKAGMLRAKRGNGFCGGVRVQCETVNLAEPLAQLAGKANGAQWWIDDAHAASTPDDW